jgi:hypothetical protein
MLAKAEARLAAAAGAAIAVAAFVRFRQAGTTVDPTDPSKPSHLVPAGVFRVSSNRMYLGCYCWPAAMLPLSDGFLLANQRGADSDGNSRGLTLGVHECLRMQN